MKILRIFVAISALSTWPIGGGCLLLHWPEDYRVGQCDVFRFVELGGVTLLGSGNVLELPSVVLP